MRDGQWRGHATAETRFEEAWRPLRDRARLRGVPGFAILQHGARKPRRKLGTTETLQKQASINWDCGSKGMTPKLTMNALGVVQQLFINVGVHAKRRHAGPMVDIYILQAVQAKIKPELPKCDPQEQCQAKREALV